MMARFVNVVASRVNPRAAAVLASGYASQVATACGRVEAPEHLRIATVVGPGGPVRTKAQYVYESLREDILQGRLRPGARLVFSQVASRFGVSPIPVREAVRQLETEGLVELKPHTRVEVTSLPWERGVWAYELRMVLEPVAVRDATPFVSEDQLARLGTLLDDLRDDLERRDADAFRAHYFAFFDQLFDAVPNRMLVQAIMELREITKRFHSVHRCEESALRGSEDTLRRVWRLLCARDADGAYEVVRAHRLESLERIKALSSREGGRLTGI
jgi:DNA-binding GntR family transcriptional regulator